MARIRSTHPTQWSSGKFLRLSHLARLLCLALRNFADDHGIFKWDEVEIKSNCLPYDHCNIEELLGELVEKNHIKKFETNEEHYGAIKDFGEFQSPQKPKPKHPKTAEICRFVKINDSETVSLQDDYSTDTVPVSLGEEGRGEEGIKKTKAKKDLEICISEWNTLAEKNDLPFVKKLTNTRRARLMARLHDCGGLEGWRVALSKIPQSDFLLGKKGDWKINFDSLIGEKVFTKLMEGAYDGSTENKSNVAELTEYLEKNGYLGEGEEEAACGSLG